MFFIGLAGSFMPYLIVTGVLLFLTLGTSKSQGDELVKLDEKRIEATETNSIQDLIVENTCYFYEKNDFQQIKEKNKSAVQKISPTITKGAPPSKIHSQTDNISVLQFLNTFSGLSPPALIS